jgi:hypothetical protein
MACIKREKNGVCSHTQCHFSDLSGYECVDIADGFCENGENCLEECPFSFKPETPEAKAAKLAFEKKYPID